MANRKGQAPWSQRLGFGDGSDLISIATESRLLTLPRLISNVHMRLCGAIPRYIRANHKIVIPFCFGRRNGHLQKEGDQTNVLF